MEHGFPELGNRSHCRTGMFLRGLQCNRCFWLATVWLRLGCFPAVSVWYASSTGLSRVGRAASRSEGFAVLGQRPDALVLHGWGR